MSKAILALDQGTHASRAMLFDNQGRSLFTRYQKVALHRTNQHEVEQDGEEILQSVRLVLNEALTYACENNLDIQCAGLATQRSTALAWDRFSGEPISHALSWQDTRTHASVNSLSSSSAIIKSRSGLILSPHYAAGKMQWLVNNVTDVARAADAGRLAIGPLAGFLLTNLLEDNPLLVDHGNASRTQLWNINTRDWDAELLGFFHIDMSWLPTCAPIRHMYGVIKGSQIPLTACNGDQNAASYANGQHGVNDAMLNLGTGAFVLSHTGINAPQHPRLLTGITDSTRVNADHCIEGTINGAGAALSWLHENWGIDAREHPEWANIENPPPFINTVGGLGSPWWFSDRAPFFPGQAAEFCADDPTRCVASVMESIAFMVHANLQEMRTAGCKPENLVTGGGLSKSDALCQRLADLTGKNIDRSDSTERTARGIAWLANARPNDWHKDEPTRFVPVSSPALEDRYQRFLATIKQIC